MLTPRVSLVLIPLVLLAAFLVLRPLSTQGAPSSQPSPPEVISDAPVCVRYYPATGETREGPEICNTRAGDPPPPTATSAAATPVPARPTATAPSVRAGTDAGGPVSGLGDWLRRLFNL